MSEATTPGGTSEDRLPLPGDISRRQFVKRAGLLALSAGSVPAILDACGNAVTSGGTGQTKKGASGPRTLSILQWSHFVPAYDTFFDPWVKAWGEKNNVTVTIDHINQADIPARTAAELQAGQGHDLILWQSPPAQYEPVTVDMGDLVKQVEKKYGPQLVFAKNSNYNPHTNHYFGFTYSYAPDPGDYRKSLFTKVGMPNGPTTYQDLLTATTAIKQQTGLRCGIGMSPEVDSNMAARAMIWSHGGSIQDANSNVTINSPETVAAVEFMAKLYKQAMTPEIFSWNAASNNQGLVAGSLSYILNSISAYRTAQQTNPQTADDIFFLPALKGPNGKGVASEHVIQTYIIPKYSKQQDTAKEFLLYLADHASDYVYQSQLYEFPVNPNTNAQKKLFGNGGWLDNDPFHSNPSNKLKVLKTASSWSVNVGYPGPASPAIGEVFDTFVLPNMMASAAKGTATPQEAVATAEQQVKAIFAKWRKQGLVGGTK
ncbi:MAG: extracellular solute-binding protein [Candidatus Dormibacteraeota bacterium]|nr:extracellular solute-binding protein [Candidatus Dormibacteraeota bacterium]